MDEELRVAWLVPSVELGAYWQPVLAEFTKVFKNTIFYTGLVWPGFDLQVPGADVIKLVGEMKSLEITKTEGYSRRVMLVSPGIINKLLQFKPQIVLAQAYSLWTLLAVLLKPWGKWRLIIIYDGSSPNSDFRDSSLRSAFRRFMSSHAEAFVANSYAAKDYLIGAVGAKPETVFTRTYLVPDAKALQQSYEESAIASLELQRPIFLYVGRITPRKGLQPLLEACSLLQAQGYRNYTLLVIGTGEQRQELEAFIRDRELENQVQWLGWVEYGRLGAYFQQADVFVFPTFEDIWGMVALEAMVFGKPVLCSQWAGAAEMIVEGENGYIFDPYDADKLATVMRRFLDNPDLITSMGDKSQQLVSQTNPASAAQAFVEVISFTLNKK
ncbi:MAG: glycosyltransferase family 4 protein [Kastovskya adunca ATA6-11-RM4]|jgi:glycosyltransferase involved in cell wall biosynthesis|nr:glycosyltransferase family 4 protein [Kastovskya adunca ATA6-11-RM4]